MANRANAWVWHKVHAANNWVTGTYGSIASHVHKFYQPGYQWAGDAVRVGSTYDRNLHNWVTRGLKAGRDKLPHPGARWEKVKSRTSALGRAEAAAELVGLGVTRLAGEAVYAAGRIANGVVEFGVRASLAVAEIVSYAAICGLKLATLALPWGLAVAGHIAADVVGVAATVVLQAPHVLRTVAEAPASWAKKGARWILHGTEAPVVSAPVVAAVESPATPVTPMVAEVGTSQAEAPTLASFTRAVTETKTVGSASTAVIPAAAAAPAATLAATPAFNARQQGVGL